MQDLNPGKPPVRKHLVMKTMVMVIPATTMDWILRYKIIGDIYTNIRIKINKHISNNNHGRQ